MLNLNRLAIPFAPNRFAVALAACLFLLGAATESRATGATDAQCSTAWSQSSADDTCSNENIYASSETECTITASCTMSNGGNRSDSITSNLNSVSNLKNCNGTIWWNC